ncbi:MAG: histidine phosphatase family protein [Acidobacteria bacterium]|nr:histidine phosphatase family protein [Acidobacteriota bacterium]
MTLKITLVRHGQSTGNAAECFTGQTDVKLSELGNLQATLTSKALSKELFTAIYSSDLERAHITAEIIAQPHKLSVNIDKRLREINLGIFQGKRFTEIAEQYPKEYEAISHRDPDVVIPEGESHGMVRSRVIKAFSEIVSTYSQGHILIVAHGGVIFHINHYIFGIKEEENFRVSYKISNCSISRYEFLALDRWRLVCFNDESHLQVQALKNKESLKINSEFNKISEQIFGCS